MKDVKHDEFKEKNNALKSNNDTKINWLASHAVNWVTGGFINTSDMNQCIYLSEDKFTLYWMLDTSCPDWGDLKWSWIFEERQCKTLIRNKVQNQVWDKRSGAKCTKQIKQVRNL